MDVYERARELLCAPRSVADYANLIEVIEIDAVDNADPCDEPHLDRRLETASRVTVATDDAGMPCTSVEASEYVTLLINGAGTVVGASVKGALIVSAED